MRLSALEQENKDLVQQVAVRDAELKRFKRERGEPGGKIQILLAVRTCCSRCIIARYQRSYYCCILPFAPCNQAAFVGTCLHSQMYAPCTHCACLQHIISPV